MFSSQFYVDWHKERPKKVSDRSSYDMKTETQFSAILKFGSLIFGAEFRQFFVKPKTCDLGTLAK